MLIVRALAEGHGKEVKILFHAAPVFLTFYLKSLSSVRMDDKNLLGGSVSFLWSVQAGR